MDDTLSPVVGGLAALLIMIGVMVLLERDKAADDLTYLRLSDDGALETVRSTGSLPQVGNSNGIQFKSVD